MADLINMILNVSTLHEFNIKKIYINKNRANAVGDGLEEFIKDSFCGGYSLNDNDRLKIYNQNFSYLGNNSNPPDIILKNSDAIEVKKIENIRSDLALNSSYPKNKLYANSRMITKECRECEGIGTWNIKDILYITGVVKNKNLTHLFAIYGDDYAAENKIYERIKDRIKEGIEATPGIEFSKTEELGRINRVDPLGITYLRIRGMWHIENPFKTFSYIQKMEEILKKEAKFKFIAIVNDEKFNSFENADSLAQNPKINIENISVKDPNNPARLKNAKLIYFWIYK